MRYAQSRTLLSVNQFVIEKSRNKVAANKNWFTVSKKICDKIFLIHYTPSSFLPLGQHLYLWDYKIYKFGKDLPALHHYAFSFPYTYKVVKKIFEFLAVIALS
jgi:hypothetical protein